MAQDVSIDGDVCVLCKKDFVEDDPVCVKEKGLKTLIRVSKEKDHELYR